MPIFSIPPMVVGALGAFGAVVLARIVAREWRRVNAELHPPDYSIDAGDAAKLTRDPLTGVYHPE